MTKLELVNEILENCNINLKTLLEFVDDELYIPEKDDNYPLFDYIVDKLNKITLLAYELKKIVIKEK